MQTYVASPKSDLSGWYIIEKWDLVQQQYFPLNGEKYPTKEQAEDRARELNRMEKEDSENFDKGLKK